MLRNISLRALLLGAFGLLLVLMLAVGVSGVRSIGSVHEGAVTEYHGSVKPLGFLGDARTRFQESRAMAYSHVLAGDDESRAKREATVAANTETIARHLRAASAPDMDPQLRRLAKQITSGWALYRTKLARMFELSGQDRDAEAYAYAVTDVAPLSAPVEKGFNDMFGRAQALAAEQDAAIDATTSSSRRLAIVLIVVSLAMGIGLALWITQRVRTQVRGVLEGIRGVSERCVQELSEHLGAMAKGDLTGHMEPSFEPLPAGRDELGQVAGAVNEIGESTLRSVAAYNEMAEQLRAMVGQVSGTATDVSAASEQMAATSEEAGRSANEIADAVGDVARGTERQAGALGDMKSGAADAEEAARRSAASAQRAAELSEHARTMAGTGVEVARDASEAMASVKASSDAVARAIGELADRSAQIGGIVDSITAIAEQTNLLALNAAIEAARAGEQGRGFAVVAEEVRKLAEESQAAAHSISGLIEQIGANTQEAVDAVGEGERRTGEAVARVERAQEAFSGIGDAIDDLHEQSQAITLAVEALLADTQSGRTIAGELATLAEESSASTEQVSASAQESAAAAQEIASSAQSLAGRAEELQLLVSKFRV